MLAWLFIILIVVTCLTVIGSAISRSQQRWNDKRLKEVERYAELEPEERAIEAKENRWHTLGVILTVAVFVLLLYAEPDQPALAIILAMCVGFATKAYHNILEERHVARAVEKRKRIARVNSQSRNYRKIFG